MDAQICQQCKEVTNSTDHRLVRDSCGHYKCRTCLVQEIDGCRTCRSGGSVQPADPGDSKPKKKRVISVAELQAELLIREREAAAKTPSEDEPGNTRKKKRDGAALPKNIVVEEDDNGVSYYCTVHKKRSRARSHITYHAYCDSQIKPHTCSICQKGFASRSHYDYHMRVHDGERPFICDTCGLAFYQKSKLKRHVLKHTGEKRFGCSVCGAAFNNAASLRKHGFIHSGEKPHECQTCHRQFRDSSNLRKHESKHQNVKHTCSQCGKQYGVKWSLMLHARSHREARPYRCLQCPQAFYSNKDMRRHAAVHSDNKPYRCTLCGTRFRRKDNLDRHLRNTHPGVDASKSFEIINDHTPDTTAPAPTVDYQASFETNSIANIPDVPAVIRKWEQPVEVVKVEPSSHFDDYTEQNILEANNRRQTVIFGPIKPPEIAKPESKEDKYKEKHFKKKITNMEIYRNILVPKYSERTEQEKPEKPIPEYIHKKVNYELMKRGEKLYCSQVPPITADKIDRIVRESSYCPKKEEDFQHPPEKIELYKKILMPDYKDAQASTSEARKGEEAREGRKGEEREGSQVSPDMHWRRRMAMNTSRDSSLTDPLNVPLPGMKRRE